LFDTKEKFSPRTWLGRVSKNSKRGTGVDPLYSASAGAGASIATGEPPAHRAAFLLNIASYRGSVNDREGQCSGIAMAGCFANNRSCSVHLRLEFCLIPAHLRNDTPGYLVEIRAWTGGTSLLKKLFSTPKECSLTVIRIAAGSVMLPHGLQKLLGWNGGPGFSRTMQTFTHNLGLPAWLVFLVIMAESFGALGMILGFFSRIAAFSIFADMIGAALLVNIHSGFFMNWSGTRKGEGIEYHILMAAMSFVVMIWGGGSLSVDRSIFPRSSPE